MNAPASIEVKVVFDAALRGRRGPTRVVPHTRTAGKRGWHVLGCFHLLVAASLYYGIWWRVDPFLYMTLMLKMPVQMDLNAAAGIFGVPGASQGPRSADASTTTLPASTSARTSQVVMGSATYGWLTLSSVSAGALSLAAGAAMARFRGTPWRRSTRVVVLLITFGLVLWSLLEWRAYGREYPPNHLRLWMGGVLLFAFAVGLLLGRFARGTTKLAAGMLLLSGAGTAAALFLGARVDAIEPLHATPARLAAAFGIHSAYGWILIPVLRWLR